MDLANVKATGMPRFLWSLSGVWAQDHREITNPLQAQIQLQQRSIEKIWHMVAFDTIMVTARLGSEVITFDSGKEALTTFLGGTHLSEF
jgi:hypothetical protein